MFFGGASSRPRHRFLASAKDVVEAIAIAINLKLFCFQLQLELNLLTVMKKIMMVSWVKIIFQKKQQARLKYMGKNLMMMIHRKQVKKIDGEDLKGYLFLKLNPS